MFVCSMAAAQTDTNPPQQTQPDPGTTVNTDTKNTADTQVEVPLDPQTTEENNSLNHEQPLKDELKTRDHVKSTPDPAIVKDKKDDKQQTVKSKRKKRNRNN